MLSRPSELFNLLKILRPDIFYSFHEFSQRYCAPKQGKYGVDYKGSSCQAELHYIMSKHVMIRRLKKDVQTQLPDKRRQKIQVHVDHKYIAQINRKLESFLGPSGQMNTQSFGYFDEEEWQRDNSDLMVAYRMSGEAKIQGCIQFIETLFESGCKFLLFAHHQIVMDKLTEFLMKKKALGGFIKIDGSTLPEARHSLVN